MARDAYRDSSNRVKPDNGPMRIAAGAMGLNTAPSDLYANSCIGELNEQANPHIIDRARERLPVVVCPGCPDGDPTGNRTIKKIPRPQYQANLSEK